MQRSELVRSTTPWERDGERWSFRCNICGAVNERVGPLPITKSCAHCLSNVRYRATALALTAGVLGIDSALVDLPQRRDVVGLGIGDWPRFARVLADRFEYVNTRRDAEPRVDLTEPPPRGLAGRHHFVIAGDVLEHVAPPVLDAMGNLRSLLRPGGAAVVTVPYAGATHIEHFPDLYRYRVEHGADGSPALVNVRRDGVEERFDALTFHGPGQSLEMRVFTRDSLEDMLRQAGFERIEFYDAQVPQHGIVHRPHWAVPVIAWAPE